jgi:RNA polymerase sigma factor for flagellar operon FliA
MDSTTRNDLIIEYGHLVRKIAQSMRRKFPQVQSIIDYEDLVSIGILGLFEAHRRYDASRGADFELFARYRIQGAMIDEIRRFDQLSRRMRDKANKLNKAEVKLRNRLGREPTETEISKELGISLGELQNLRTQVQKFEHVSIDDVQWTLEASIPTPETFLQYKQRHALLLHALQQLNERQQIVLDLYYNRGFKLIDIAEVLELSEGRVSQIKTDTIMQIREFLSKE